MARFTDMFTELVRLEMELWNGLDATRANSGQARVQDVSCRMAITVGATSKVVDRLERDGLALRTPHPTDRRSSIASLSDKGAAALKSADDEAESHLRDELGGVLSDNDAGRLLGDLMLLRAQSRAAVVK